MWQEEQPGEYIRLFLICGTRRMTSFSFPYEAVSMFAYRKRYTSPIMNKG